MAPGTSCRKLLMQQHDFQYLHDQMDCVRPLYISAIGLAASVPNGNTNNREDERSFANVGDFFFYDKVNSVIFT